MPGPPVVGAGPFPFPPKSFEFQQEITSSSPGAQPNTLPVSDPGFHLPDQLPLRSSLPVAFLQPWLFVWNRPAQSFYSPGTPGAPVNPQPVGAPDPGFVPNLPAGQLPIGFLAPWRWRYNEPQYDIGVTASQPNTIPASIDPGFVPTFPTVMVKPPFTKPWAIVWNHPSVPSSAGVQPQTVYPGDPGFSANPVPSPLPTGLRPWSLVWNRPQIADLPSGAPPLSQPQDPGFRPTLPAGRPPLVLLSPWNFVFQNPALQGYSQAQPGVPRPTDPGFQPIGIPNPFWAPEDVSLIFRQPQFDGVTQAPSGVPKTPDPGFAAPPVPTFPQVTAPFVFRGLAQFQDYSTAQQPNTIPAVDPGLNPPRNPLSPQPAAPFVFANPSRAEIPSGSLGVPTPPDPGVQPKSPPLPFFPYLVVFRNPQWQDYSVAAPSAGVPPDPGVQPRRYPLPFAPSNFMFRAQMFWQDYSSAPLGVPTPPDPGVGPLLPPFAPGSFALPGIKLRFPPTGAEEYSPAPPGVPGPQDPGFAAPAFLVRGPTPFTPAWFVFNRPSNPVGPQSSLCSGVMSVIVTTREPMAVVTSPNAEEYENYDGIGL